MSFSTPGNLSVTASLLVSTVGQLDDLNIVTHSNVVFNGLSSQVITGMIPTPGKFLFVHNQSLQNLTIKNESSASSAVNRCVIGTGLDMILAPDQMGFFIYNTDTNRWRGLSLPAAIQVNSDWNSISGFSNILNKPNISTVGRSGNYSDIIGLPVLFNGAYTSLTGLPTLFNGQYSSLSGLPALFDGNYNSLNNKPSLFNGVYSSLTGLPTLFNGDYNSLSNKPSIPFAQVNSDWTAVSGISQILNKPNIPAAQINSDWTANAGISQIINKPTFSTVAISGLYTDLLSKPSIPAAQVNSDWNSGSGISQILNKPSLATVAISGSYNDLISKPSIQAPLTGTGLVRSTSGTISYDTSTYLTANQSISISGDITGSGTTSITATLVSVGTASTYSTVTTDSKGRVISGKTPSQSSPVRSFNTAYRPSTTQDATVNLSITISITSVLAGTNVGTVQAQISSDNISYATVAQVSNSIGGVISTNSQTAGMSFYVPTGWYVKLITSQSGVNTPTFAISANQEVLY